MGRPNAWTQLHNQFRRIRPEMLAHLLDRVRNDRVLGPLLARMHQADHRLFWIDKINGAAIGNVNAKRDLSQIRYDSIATGEFFVARHRKIDNRDLVAMDLLRSQERPIGHSNLASDLPMNTVEPAKRFSFIVRNVDAGNTFDERVPAHASVVQGGKVLDRFFSGQWNFAVNYLELGSRDIGVTGVTSKELWRFGLPRASTSLPV
jgi:hypothetical protein